MAKARPEVTWGHGPRHAYTPTRTAHAQAQIAEYARRKLGANWTPLTGAIRLTVEVCRPVPAHVRKRVARTLPIQRPDLDNYLKLVIDALSPRGGDAWGLWCDDAQIVELYARKRYADATGAGWFVKGEELELTESGLYLLAPTAADPSRRMDIAAVHPAADATAATRCALLSPDSI